MLTRYLTIALALGASACSHKRHGFESASAVYVFELNSTIHDNGSLYPMELGMVSDGACGRTNDARGESAWGQCYSRIVQRSYGSYVDRINKAEKIMSNCHWIDVSQVVAHCIQE